MTMTKEQAEKFHDEFRSTGNCQGAYAVTANNEGMKWLFCVFESEDWAKSAARGVASAHIKYTVREATAA